MIASGFAAETVQQDRLARAALIWSAEEYSAIMWHWWGLSPGEGTMKMQWSGIVAAGITNIEMPTITATNFPIHVIPTPLCRKS
jgi:hypothetical protein